MYNFHCACFPHCVFTSGAFPLEIVGLSAGSHKIELTVQGLRGESVSLSLTVMIIGKNLNIQCCFYYYY